ncbi:MAG: aspartate/glutamate racemase family protein, partial [candidate division NC10 bacterium]
ALAGGKLLMTEDEVQETMSKFQADLKQKKAQGAQAVIAGCTEIPIVLQDGDLSVPVVDATLALALRAVREARG